MFPAAPKAKDGEVLTFAGGRWQPRTPAASGVPEAPVDGTQYARKDGAWDPVAASVTLADDREVNTAEPPASSDTRLRTPFAINYMANPDAEINATGWVAGSSSPAGTSPNAGEGAGGITVTRSTASPLSGSASFLFPKDAANRQGYCARFDFAIDRCDRNRSLTLAFRVNAYTGTYTPGAVSAWVWDVDAAKLCPIGQNSIDASGSMAVQWTSSGSTNYRIILHVAGTDANAYDLQFDNFYVGPAYLPSAPAMSDWQDGGAITIEATTTNPTKGTTTVDKVRWRRVGDTAEIAWEYLSASGGGNGSGSYLLKLPAGLVIDTAKIAASTINPDFLAGCPGSFQYSNGTTAIVGSLQVYDSTRLTFSGLTSGTAAFNTVTSSAGGWVGARLGAYCRVPIVGWGGTTAVQPGSRYLWAQRFAANATRVTTTPSKPGEYRARRDTTDTAPTDAPSLANGVRIDAGSGLAAGRISWWDIYVGPGKIVQAVFNKDAGRSGFIEASYHVNSTYYGCLFSYDVVTGIATIRAQVANATDYVGVNTVDRSAVSACYFDLLVADDPVPVAMAPSVHVEASSDAGQVLTANTTNVNFEDEQIDTHGAWDGAGLFTTPVAGVYFVACCLCNTSGAQLPTIYKNGTLVLEGTYQGSSGQRAQASATLRLAAGDTVSIRNAASVTLDSVATRNWLRITRIGDT